VTFALIFGVGAVLFVLGAVLARHGVTSRPTSRDEMSHHAATIVALRDLQRRQP